MSSTPRAISAKYGSTMSPTSTPTIPDRRVTSARASAEGEYCRCRAAASTRCRVAAATGYSTLFRTREAVVMDTPARLATSTMPGIGRLLFNGTGGDTRDDLLLRKQKGDDNRNHRHDDGGHHLVGDWCLLSNEGQADLQRAHIRRWSHDHRPEQLVPGAHEDEQRQRRDSRARQWQVDAGKDPILARAIDDGCFAHLGRECPEELRHHEDAEGAHHARQNDA